MTADERSKYWQSRCVKAEMKLIEIQAFMEGEQGHAARTVHDKIDGYFNEVAKGSQSDIRDLEAPHK